MIAPKHWSSFNLPYPDPVSVAMRLGGALDDAHGYSRSGFLLRAAKRKMEMARNRRAPSIGAGSMRVRIDLHSLGEFPLPVVCIDCPRCERAGSYRLDGLFARFGADAALPDLLIALASCEDLAQRPSLSTRRPVVAIGVVARPSLKPEDIGRDGKNPLEQNLSWFLKIVGTDEHFRQRNGVPADRRTRLGKTV